MGGFGIDRYITQKFEFLSTAFAVISMPLALPIVPKVEFNVEVIM